MPPGQHLGRIERLPDWRATLHYPGFKPRIFNSAAAAFNQRRKIELGKCVASVRRPNENTWTDEEGRIAREIWGTVPRAKYAELLPSRTYSALKTYCRNQKIRVDPDFVAQKRKERLAGLSHKSALNPWSVEEDRIVREIWGRLKMTEYEEQLPGRKYRSISAYCQRRGIKADREAQIERFRRLPQRNAWTPDQIRILLEHPRDRARELLRGVKASNAVKSMALRLGLKSEARGRFWSQEEMLLVRAIERSMKALRERHGRTSSSIEKKRARERQAEKRMSQALEAIKGASAHLSAHVRADVEGEVLVQVLAGEVKLSDVREAVRRTVARVYGPRHFSLDAPVGNEASVRWIDTIESDRPHF